MANHTSRTLDPRPKRRLNRGMKAILFALFVALLMVGCVTTKTKDAPKVEADSHPSDNNSTTKKKLAWIRAKEKLESQMKADKLNEEFFRKRMNLDVNETRKTSSTFQGLTLEELLEEFHPSKDNLPEGKAFPSSSSYNNSNHHRLKTSWYENGQKESVINFKDGDPDGSWTEWYENGQKEGEGSFKDGKEDGLWIAWHENGQKQREMNFKVGRLMSVEVWKPNGEKCPVTNVKDGNGVMVWYKEDGTVSRRYTYKDGEPVYD